MQFPIFVFESDLGLSAIRSLIVGGGPAVTTGDEYTVRYVEQCKETIAPVGKHLEPGFPLKHPATGSGFSTIPAPSQLCHKRIPDIWALSE